MSGPDTNHPAESASTSHPIGQRLNPEVSTTVAAGAKAPILSARDLLILGAVFAACIGGVWYFLSRSALITGPVEMGIHGWIAMGLGVIFSLIVGIGLMWLVFFSARHGFDDRVNNGRD